MTLANGSGRADVRFDGSTLKVLAGVAGVPPPLRNGMTVGQSGQVQMGGDYFPVGPANVTLVVNNPVNDRAIYARTNTGSVSGNFLPAIVAINDGNGDGLQAISTGGNAIVAYGTLKVTNLASAGSTQLCWNASQQIATCSSSLRYKQHQSWFSGGLQLINRLNPISFEWIADGMHDVGFGAEDVAKIDPLFVTYNKSGDVEGVKYDRLSVLFVNAFKEQQTQIAGQARSLESQSSLIESQTRQIEALQQRLDQQQRQLATLQRLACERSRGSDACTE